MAVDTRDKRMSMIGLGSPVPSVLPNPDGAIGAADRAQLLWLYSGISLVAPSAFVAAFTIRPTLQEIQSYLAASGEFVTVELGEPEAVARGDGLTAAIWVSGTRIALTTLTKVTKVYDANIRVYRDMLGEPTEGIEIGLAKVVQDIASDLLGDYDLGATVRDIDACGQYGTPLRAEWGHDVVAGVVFRVVDMTIPIVVNDTAALTA